MDKIMKLSKGVMNTKKSSLTLFLMALPFIILVFLFSYVPIFGWSFAFFDYKPGIPLSKTPFIGLKYFHLILEYKGDIIRVVKNTLVLGFLGIVTTPLPVIFAILLNEIRNDKFKKIVQTMTTIPNFISWVIVYGLAYAFFSTEGVVNKFLMDIGRESLNGSILGNADMVWVFQTCMTIWKTLGWNAIIYIAAIAGIDGELYSAARVDGAGRLRRILHVTIPGIAQTYVVLLLLSISGLLSVGFEQYFVFKNPMVIDNIEVLDLYVYKLGITSNDYSFATAVGILKTLISVTLLFTVNGISKKIRGGQSIF